MAARTTVGDKKHTDVNHIFKIHDCFLFVPYLLWLYRSDLPPGRGPKSNVAV